jgi:hypothetical protein
MPPPAPGSSFMAPSAGSSPTFSSSHHPCCCGAAVAFQSVAANRSRSVADLPLLVPGTSCRSRYGRRGATVQPPSPRKSTGYLPIFRARKAGPYRLNMSAASASASGNVSAMPATGCPLWSMTAAATDEKCSVTSPHSVAYPCFRTRPAGRAVLAACAARAEYASRMRRVQGRARGRPAAGTAASTARPLAVSCAGSRTPTSVTSGGRPGRLCSVFSCLPAAWRPARRAGGFRVSPGPPGRQGAG